MIVSASLTRWLDALAELLLVWHASWRARRPVFIRQEAGRLLARTADSQEDTVLVDEAGRAAAASATVRAARRCFVIYELPAQEVVVRHMRVPGRARGFLSGIVSTQIDRLSPWPASQAVYGFEADQNATEEVGLNVRVLITSRGIVAQTRSALAAIGFDPDRIVAPQACGSLTLWSRGAEGHQRIRRVLAAALAGLVAVSLATSLWALVTAAGAARQGEEMLTRIADLRRQMLGARAPQTAASHDPGERAWRLKEDSPSAVMLIEALSRALPDNAYLTELTLDRTTVRVVGMATDAPSLIAPLEQSGLLSDVHFFAPATRGADGNQFRFSIEARVASPTRATAQ